jgi:hypothetical protein
MEEKKTVDKISIDIVDGVEGLSLYINDYRVAGPKPWGGGTIKKQWRVKKETFIDSLQRSGAINLNKGEKE